MTVLEAPSNSFACFATAPPKFLFSCIQIQLTDSALMHKAMLLMQGTHAKPTPGRPHAKDHQQPYAAMSQAQRGHKHKAPTASAAMFRGAELEGALPQAMPIDNNVQPSHHARWKALLDVVSEATDSAEPDQYAQLLSDGTATAAINSAKQHLQQLAAIANCIAVKLAAGTAQPLSEQKVANKRRRDAPGEADAGPVGKRIRCHGRKH